ncbi:MAG TPA: PTS lactose/cellobiose transporter subunit IIA [Dermatophilaceae bacterium]|jgi:PTS system cellobiose-specific IIA component
MITEELARTAMNIILPSGDARNYIRSALDAIGEANLPVAQHCLAEARAKLAEAHRAQTEIVQGEAAGDGPPYSVLFTHAQDTLMTVMSEHGMATRIVGLMNNVNERLAAMEAQR